MQKTIFVAAMAVAATLASAQDTVTHRPEVGKEVAVNCPAITSKVDQNGIEFHKDDVRYYATRMEEARKLVAICDKADKEFLMAGAQAMCAAAKSAIACNTK